MSRQYMISYLSPKFMRTDTREHYLAPRYRQHNSAIVTHKDLAYVRAQQAKADHVTMDAYTARRISDTKYHDAAWADGMANVVEAQSKELFGF